MKLKLIGCAFLLLCFVFGNAQNKIGYLDENKLYASLPEIKAIDSAVLLFMNEYSTTINKQLKVEIDAYNLYVKDSTKFTRQQNQKRYEEYVTKYNELSDKVADKNPTLQKREQLLKPVRDKISKALQDYAKQNGFAHIIYAGNALIINEEDDITEKVVEKLLAKK